MAYTWLDSVYSDTTKNFVTNPYPKKGEKVTFYIRMLKNADVKHVFLRARQYGVEYLYKMEFAHETENLVYYKVEVEIKDKYFNYQFYLVTDSETFYYTQYRITDYIPGEEYDFVLLADYDAPLWVKDSVFYQIFPDRFCNGKEELNVKSGEYSYQGFSTTEEKWETPALPPDQGHNVDFRNGDLYGIIKRLDYLQKLGINAIYLNPIFVSPSMHKYDALDYFHIDPHLGGDEAFEELCKEIHKRNMKILLDISVNHTSSSAKWFNKDGEFYPKSEGAFNDKNSPYRKFYFINDDNTYASWFGVQTMPQLNYGSEELRKVIYKDNDSVLKKWMLPPYQIDGWRFDVADCLARNEILDVHDEVLSEIRTELKKVNSEAYLLAEEWADCSGDLKGNRWDATMNYFGTGRALREFAGGKDLYNERNETLKKLDVKLTAKRLSERIFQFLRTVPGAIQLQQFNLFDSHDVNRLHNIETVTDKSLEGAILLQFTLPGTPSVYYGDEIYIDGKNVYGSDYGCRFPFNWEWEKNEKSRKTFDFYKKLISIRKKEDVLRDGSFTIVYAEDYTIVTARFNRNEVIFTVVSRDDVEKEIMLPLQNFGISIFNNSCPSADMLGKKLNLTVSGENNLKLKVPSGESYIIKISSSRK